jgi:branched-chain amino acid transport system permease protein
LTFVLIGGTKSFLGPVLGGMVFTALPEVLRAIADTSGLPSAVAQFLRDGRLIIFGLLIVVGTIFFPQGLVTPNLFKRRSKSEREQSKTVQ